MRKVLKGMRCDLDSPFTFRLYYDNAHYLYRYDNDIAENKRGEKFTQLQLHDKKRRK